MPPGRRSASRRSFAALLAAALSEAERQRRELREAAARSAGELDAARRIQMGLLPDTAGRWPSRRSSLPPSAARARAHRRRRFLRLLHARPGPPVLPRRRCLRQGHAGGAFHGAVQGDDQGRVMSSGAEPDEALRRAAPGDRARQSGDALRHGVRRDAAPRQRPAALCNAGHEPPYCCGAGGAVQRLPTAPRPPLVRARRVRLSPPNRRQLAPGDWICALITTA